VLRALVALTPHSQVKPKTRIDLYLFVEISIFEPRTGTRFKIRILLDEKLMEVESIAAARSDSVPAGKTSGATGILARIFVRDFDVAIWQAR
jgi:hypothetical protein